MFDRLRLSALLPFFLLNFAHPAHSQPACPDPLPTGAEAKCRKELRIINNTSVTIYAAIQSNLAPADGDDWLVAALGGQKANYKSDTYYRIYINPVNGIKPGEIASISIPWWSKVASSPAGSTPYVDWWNGGRVYIFDDRNALNDTYTADHANWIGGSPTVGCSSFKPNACTGDEFGNLTIYRKAEDFNDLKTPAQLNEYTFAQVENGKLLTFNINYNISNVDSVYLPIAMEIIAAPGGKQFGWIGTDLDHFTFRTRLDGFSAVWGAAFWPTYPFDTKKYPNAGVKLPAIYPALAHPDQFPTSGGNALDAIWIKIMINQWNNCISDKPKNCVASEFYKNVYNAFKDNYAYYKNNCKNIPPHLKPEPGTDLPKQHVFLSYVYGWVPFNNNCTAAGLYEELPCAAPDDKGKCKIVNEVPSQYKRLQDNWSDNQRNPAAIFNFYSQLVHDKNWLNAHSVYAYSIDDDAAFYSDPGVGLAIAVGGVDKLPNTKRRPPTPQPKTSISVALGNPAPTQSPNWASFGVCSDRTDESFINPRSPDDPTNLSQQFWVDTRTWSGVPCVITIEDDQNRGFQFTIIKNLPWSQTDSKSTVLANCLAPKDWCNQINLDIQPAKNVFAVTGPALGR
jgi:hypothetical protein